VLYQLSYLGAGPAPSKRGLVKRARL
jgi:hypothetical protein